MRKRNKMRCLVLGGGGFIGSNLCYGLIEAGHEVSVFEKERLSKSNLLDIQKRVRWIEGDFLNPEHVKAAVTGMDIIFHAIGTTVPQSSNESPVYDINSNVVPTLHLLEAAQKADIKKIIFFSSGGTIYGIPQIIPIPEEHPTMPICSYGIHKLMIEKYLSLYHKLHNLDFTVLRVSNPYGEKQRQTGKQGAISVFTYKALKGEPIEVWGDGSVVRDYLHISDVVRAAILSINSESDEKILNIGSGKGLSLNDVIKCIEDSTGLKLNVRYTAGRSCDVPVNILDISRVRKSLGWNPETDLTTGIKRTADYIRAHMDDDTIDSDLYTGDIKYCGRE